jgi:molecular chaperone GrpE
MKPKGGADDGLDDAIVDAGTEDGAAGTASAESPSEAASIEDIEGELESAREELVRTMDQFRRLAADFDNYRKRIERERVEAHSRAQADLVKRLLEIVDDFERVAAIDEETPVIEGVRLVERKFLQVLQAAGLEGVNAEGAPFDPTTMEGLATVPTEVAAEDDHVADVFQKGYLFKCQLLRPARVRVKRFEA